MDCTPQGTNDSLRDRDIHCTAFESGEDSLNDCQVAWYKTKERQLMKIHEALEICKDILLPQVELSSRRPLESVRCPPPVAQPSCRIVSDVTECREESQPHVPACPVSAASQATPTCISLPGINLEHAVTSPVTPVNGQNCDAISIPSVTNNALSVQQELLVVSSELEKTSGKNDVSQRRVYANKARRGGIVTSMITQQPNSALHVVKTPRPRGRPPKQFPPKLPSDITADVPCTNNLLPSWHVSFLQQGKKLRQYANTTTQTQTKDSALQRNIAQKGSSFNLLSISEEHSALVKQASSSSAPTTEIASTSNGSNCIAFIDQSINGQTNSPDPVIISTSRAQSLKPIETTHSNEGSDTSTKKITLTEHAGDNHVMTVRPSVIYSPLLTPVNDVTITQTSQPHVSELENNTERAGNPSVIDLTEDEASFKQKTFPSLMVTARAGLKSLTIPANVLITEQSHLNNTMERMLQLSPTSLTEHLLRLKLLRTGQTCSTHNQKLKIGSYSNTARFPLSGGYVWVSECCNSGVSSVFLGSIFDKTSHSPSTILKLMFHWASNTVIRNVVNWVDVDNIVVKTYYTLFRAVCTTAVHEKMTQMGGPFKAVQIGVISLGTTGENSQEKKIKVDILAVLDVEAQHIRLKALESDFQSNLSPEKVYGIKFKRMLETLKLWVNPQSTVITNFAVDFPLCREYGFFNVIASGSKNSQFNNNAVVEYLKRWVPQMFENALDQISFPIIQQFLDELTWRECWGPIPRWAFDCLLEHLAEITKLPGPGIIDKLKRISADPTKDWRFSVWSKVPISVDNSGTKTEEESKKSAPSTSKSSRRKSAIVRKDDSTDTESIDGDAAPTKLICDKDNNVFLEAYYYGHIEGNPKLQKSTGAFLVECAVCTMGFSTGSSFTTHLIQHALNPGTMSLKLLCQPLNICRYCLRIVGNLDTHISNRHPHTASSSPTICRICAIDMKTHRAMKKHMAAKHCELDMPYFCEACSFRTSIFECFEPHYRSCHDRSSFLQCPFCLKTVHFNSKTGVPVPKNQIYFVQHIQKHCMPKMRNDCDKCTLSFLTNRSLIKHQRCFHSSCRNVANVVRYKGKEDSIVIVKPKKTSSAESIADSKTQPAVSNTHRVDQTLADHDCIECEGPITNDHFSEGLLNCTSCQYHTQCLDSMLEHNHKSHPKIRPICVGGSPILNKPLACSECEFDTVNGNRMATHLAKIHPDAEAIFL